MKKNRFTRKLEEIGLLIQNYRHIRKYTLQMLSKLTGQREISAFGRKRESKCNGIGTVQDFSGP
mgnify:CR=1 FL=1